MRFTRTLILLTLLAGILAACGGDDPTPTPLLPTLAPTSTPSETPTITPTPSETFTPAPTIPTRAGLPATWTPRPEGEVATAVQVNPDIDLDPDVMAFGATLEEAFIPSIWIINAGGFGQRRILGSAYNPSWSPDGTRFVFESELITFAPRPTQDPNSFATAVPITPEPIISYDIVIVPDDGNDEINLTREDEIDNFEPKWAPVGDRIVFRSDRNLDGQFELYTMLSDGSGFAPVSSRPVMEGGYDWAPDGQRLVYIGVGASQTLFVVNADGTGETQIITDTALHPAWSPDGSQIAYTCGTSVCAVNADGSNRRVVAESGQMPDWSPDGSQIVYSCGDVCVVTLATGEIATLTSGLNTQSPKWSNSGRQIAFFATQVERYLLYVMEADGSELTELISDPSPLSALSWRPGDE